MDLLCYNKGCGQRYKVEHNKEDSCLFHSGVPIFHDALKGWSCCRKRTTDFSEFLNIKGCTHGHHSNQKPQEPLRPEVSSDKGENKFSNGPEIIFQGPKSAEKLQRERPSSDESRSKLPLKVSPSLVQQLEKLDVSQAEQQLKESQTVIHGTRCKNSGCKTIYQGPETNLEVCTHHPGAPVFHEGYKYWSCCCIQTTDFNAFLEQKGCSTGTHRWSPKQDKKKVACRFDWHQTANNVFVTIYAKNAIPQFSLVEANRTVLSCQIQFENNKLFKKDFHLWGVVDVQRSSVSLVPSKVEVILQKVDRVSWGKLEDPSFKVEPQPDNDAAVIATATDQPPPPDWDIDDDDISDSDDEWAYDTPPKKPQEGEEVEEKKVEVKREEEEKVEVKKVEEEKVEVKKEGEEDEEGQYDDLPPLDD